MTCFTCSTSTAYCSTDRQLRSECTTTLATFRCTNSSPGNNPTISLAGTRESEQPIHRYDGACCAASCLKKPGWAAVTVAAHCRLLSNRWERSLTCGSLLLRAGPTRGGLLLPGIQIVPVHDRVEAERVGALRLPAPERTNREHHDVTLAERRIERRRPIGEELRVQQRARQQHVVRVGRELHHDARTRVVDGDAELLRHLAHLRHVVSRRPLAAPAGP